MRHDIPDERIMYKQSKIATLFFALTLPALCKAQSCNITSVIASTPTYQFINHHNGTVTDKNTGLIWKKCSEGQTWNNNTDNCAGNATTYSWQGALNRAQTLNRLGGFAGKKDWRVPNIQELYSIIEEQCYYPAVNITVFPTVYKAAFWSSSPHNGESSMAWGVIFDFGYDSPYYKSSNNQIRLVRSGQ